MPDCIKILVNECNTMGETLMRHTLHRFGVIDEKGNKLITLDKLMAVLRLFQYQCSIVDQNELRFWIFNNDLTAKDLPQHYREDVIFLDIPRVLE